MKPKPQTTSNKIQPTHLKRQAVVYIRQSSIQQVEQNLESQKRQYQLVQQAQVWGWNQAQCVVIDAKFNDRLLLGLKGTISEVELYQIKARMVRGRMNKVERGEYQFGLPVGLEWDTVSGEIRLSPDSNVRHTLKLVFHLFE